MILHKSFNFKNINLSHPKANKSTGLSARSLFKDKIQLGSEELPCSVLYEKLAVKSRKALTLSLTNECTIWFKHFEEVLTKVISEKSLSWFDVEYSEKDIQRMLVSCVQNRNLITLHYSKLNCYKIINDDINQIDTNDLSEGDILLPNIVFEGIFIGKRHISPSFKICDLLVVGKNEIDNSPHPFKNVFEDEDILDPATFFENDDYSSNASFDTYAFAQQ